jgi:hypothetical protein
VSAAVAAADLPRFSPVDDPELNAHVAAGVRIVGPGIVEVGAPYVISGKFVISEDEHRRRAATPHRDLVLTVLRDPLYASGQPFGRCVFFGDDVLLGAGTAAGWFTFDVWAYSGFREPGTYFVRVSLGDALSAYVETIVR